MIDEVVLADARKEGLQLKLTSLMDRPEIAATGLGAQQVLAALREAGGKVPAAKRTLLRIEAPKPTKKHGKVPAAAEAQQLACDLIGKEVMEQACRAGLEAELRNLAGRAEMRGLPAERLLDALQRSDGLVNKAKVALLSEA